VSWISRNGSCLTSSARLVLSRVTRTEFASCCRLAIMPNRHDKLTIISMAIVASASATLLHEGVGHGLTAWLRGDIPTELTSNHLSSLRPDRWVDAGGTLVNLFVGANSLLASRVAGDRANARYFFWIFAAFNLLHGAGYFLFSGASGFGDWHEVIRGLPHQVALRIGMTVFGAVMYFLAVWLLAVSVRRFVADRRTYNVVGRLPYCAAALFSCAAGALDPLGIKLLLVSTIPAAFGGSSGLLWADSLLPRTTAGRTLLVRRQIAWWFAAAILGGSYIAFIGRGIRFPMFPG
jgi:hypothetical protein